MTIKVVDIARELNVDTKKLLAKITSMGIDAKEPGSLLNDADAAKIRNIVKKSRAAAETKIVKAPPKKAGQNDIDEPRVVVKAANIKPPIQHAKPVVTNSGAGDRPVARPPIGKPVVSKDLENRRRPVGTPVAKEITDRQKAMGEAVPSVAETAAASAQEKASEAAAVQVASSAGEKPVEAQAAVKNPQAAEQKQAPAAAASANQAADSTQAAPEKTQAAPAGAASAESKAAESTPASEGAAVKESPAAKETQAVSAKDAQGTQQGGRDGRGYGDRPQRQGGDRQYGDRNNGERGYGDRNGGQGRYGDRPQRRDGDRQYGDRNNGERGYGDRNGGQGRYGDRPQRQGGDRQYGDRNNGERGYGDRNGGQGRYGDRPQRQGGDRQSGDRPQRQGDRNQGSYGDRKKSFDKPAVSEVMKPTTKRNDDKKKTDKERDKFAKLEGGKKAKNVRDTKSLEKSSKPKKHVKKEKQVEEPQINMEELPAGTRVINVPITVAGFCEQLEISTSRVIMALMKLGIMANINQNLNEDTVLILADELGISVVLGNVEEEVVEEGLEVFEDDEEDLKSRPPIITVMGHVDHGKTSLLDCIRKTHVTASESGGITQHIGASEVVRNGQKIVFLDTPGHEAFTAMRARGAHVTDIAVLVVAADDSVKPQTVESISHAKAAGVPIIVAINKIDKPGANPDKVKQDLTEHGILVEDWGGDTISVPVSAKTGEGIDELLDMILLQAEMLELKANPNRLALGTVIEARLDKAKGPVATLLVLNGTLKQGMSVVAGTCSGKIRLMTNFKGDKIKKAGPATAVEILGLTDVPQAGDEFNAVKDDKIAREIAENRKTKLREEVLARNASTTLEALFSQIQEGEIKELNLIIKADVQGSVGAIVSSLEKLKAENVRVKIIHTGVGTVTESDVMLASTAGAVIIGFNVRPPAAVTAMADRDNVEIRTYRVIYDIINDVEDAIKGMLDPVFKEEVLGQLEIRNTFKVPGVGIVGGAYVTDGKVIRNAEIRLVRDGIVIHEGKISSLKRFKDDVREVNQGYECGIGIENYNDIKEGDVIECFHMTEVERK